MKKRNLEELVIYQIYPRSFQDTSGNGIGDLNGIRKRLNYLHKLGIDMIWITPFYPSGGRDNGYDVKDYTAIDPLFGSMSDFKNLVKEAKALDIGIMLDMVLNHTSTKHKWFQKALKGDPKYMDYYFFVDKPVNWQSKFGGSAFKYVEHLDKYYLHLFDEKQADLNWENPYVRQELYDVVKFWMDLGVEGFRFDVINLISKPQIFKDSLIGDGRDAYTDGEKVLAYLQELNEKTFGTKDLVTVGELSSTTAQKAASYVNPENNALSTAFGFHHLKIDYKDNLKWHLQKPNYDELKKILVHWQNVMEENKALMALFWNNHDQPRSVSRLGDDLNYPYESATMIATMMHMLKGMPYIYQGEELGLPNAYFTSLDDYKDVESLNMIEILKEKFTQKELEESLSAHSRDNGRTPIPWDNTAHYGFSNVEPWIKFSQAKNLKTAQDVLSEKESIFTWYQRLIDLRHTHKIVSKGKVNWPSNNNQNLLYYTRELNGEIWHVYNNVTNEKITLNLEHKITEIILSNYNRLKICDKLDLEAYETLVLKE
ncbi:MAG TPA: alpha,alpha-phosphotrehalase [Erysipelothrix sp.]|nr:alpha,alpha-phosphotrehalase [Erysipelothrix sp.]